MPGGHSAGSVCGSPMFIQGPPPTGMQYRGTLPPGPPPSGPLPTSTTPLVIPPMPQNAGIPLRGSPYQVSSSGAASQALRLPGPPPMGTPVRAAAGARPPTLPSSGSALGAPPFGPPPRSGATQQGLSHFVPPPSVASRGPRPDAMATLEVRPSASSSLGNSVSDSASGILLLCRGHCAVILDCRFMLD